MMLNLKSILAAVVVSQLSLVSVSVGAEGKDVVSTYQATCNICHSGAIPTAPRKGDVAAWAPRLEKGMDVLVASVTTGLNAMPPKGMCMDCSADDFKALIEHMTKAQ